MKVILILTLCAMSIEATLVKKCSADSPEVDSKNFQIGDCQKPPCDFRRKTSSKVELKFVPDHDVKSVKNNIKALVAGVYAPYVGVDGTDACGSIYDGKGEKVSCPLKAGQEYTYKGEFKVEEWYPKIRTEVKWALVANDGKSLFCFKVRIRVL